MRGINAPWRAIFAVPPFSRPYFSSVLSDPDHSASNSLVDVPGGGGDITDNDEHEEATDDEGIEQDHDPGCSSSSSSSSSSPGPSNGLPASGNGGATCRSSDSILTLCENHLSVESEAEAHYRNVCRALVSEALELSMFLEKASARSADHDSEELRALAVKDWVGTQKYCQRW